MLVFHVHGKPILQEFELMLQNLAGMSEDVARSASIEHVGGENMMLWTL